MPVKNLYEDGLVVVGVFSLGFTAAYLVHLQDKRKYPKEIKIVDSSWKINAEPLWNCLEWLGFQLSEF